MPHRLLQEPMGPERAAAGPAPKWGGQQEGTTWGLQSSSQPRKASPGSELWGKEKTPKHTRMEEKEFGGHY